MNPAKLEVRVGKSRRRSSEALAGMIEVPGAPHIDGLTFRRFIGDSDFSAMAAIGKMSWEADRVDFFETAEEIANDYRSSPDWDPYLEVLIAEVKGEPIAYGRILSEPGSGGERIYWHFVHVVPEWRKDNLRLAMLRFNERQIISMVESEQRTEQCVFKVWALDEPNDWRDMLLAEGYKATMHFFEMIRHSLVDIPETQLPGGLKFRPAKPEDYPKVWRASKEAFRGKPWFNEARYEEKYYDSWLSSPLFMPEYWQVVWDGGEVAGMAQNYVAFDANRAFNRDRGHTQSLFVMPKWRKRGLGRALLAESLKMMRDEGLKEASLDVETQSTSGELQLYESMGYVINRSYSHYAKPIDARTGSLQHP